jgi:hypothetical protein
MPGGVRMICCKCGEKTKLAPRTPVVEVCDTCCHEPCHDCDYEGDDEIEETEESEEFGQLFE